MTVFVRPARPEDSENFTSWYSNSESFDPNVIRFPETYVLCAFKQNKILGYMPVQSLHFPMAQVLDSLVMNPEATDLEIAASMREFVKHAITLGYLKDCDCIYFIGNHPETNKIAERIFTKVEYPVYKLNLEDLEGLYNG